MSCARAGRKAASGRYRSNARLAPRAFQIPAAIADKFATDRRHACKESVVKDRIYRLTVDKRLVEVAHWTVFAIGALTLAFSVAATAASAF